MRRRRVEDPALQPLRFKLDPGSKATGMAMILDGQHGAKVVFFGEIVHKPGIKSRLDDRRTHRRGRRHRKTRYRKPHFQNRKRKEGWLPPSLEARVDLALRALAKLRKFAPITDLSVEHVKFDTQKMQNPEISGVEYQQGTLLGYEVREYLLEKWHRRCAYCDAEDGEFQVGHVHPKDLGGSDRVSNLALACSACNTSKNNQLLAEFLARDAGRRRSAAQCQSLYRQESLQAKGAGRMGSHPSRVGPTPDSSSAEGCGGDERHPLAALQPTAGHGAPG